MMDVTAVIPDQVQRIIFDTPLSIQRYKWVQEFIKHYDSIKSVTDLGCGNGRIANWLKNIPQLELINFVDIDQDLLIYECDNYIRPGLCEMLFGRQNTTSPLNIKVYHADLTVPDARLYADCLTLVEVIEHMELNDVERLSRAVFGYYQPRFVIVTTPNSEFNHLLRREGEDPSKFRHYDHKFEWTRAQFVQWCQEVCSLFPYTFSLDGVGHLPDSEPFGPCTQIAVFQRKPTTGIDQNVDREMFCFDLLMDKLDLKDPIREFEVDKGRKKASLLLEYRLPGQKHCQPTSDLVDCDWTSGG